MTFTETPNTEDLTMSIAFEMQLVHSELNNLKVSVFEAKLATYEYYETVRNNQLYIHDLENNATTWEHFCKQTLNHNASAIDSFISMIPAYKNLIEQSDTENVHCTDSTVRTREATKRLRTFAKDLLNIQANA